MDNLDLILPPELETALDGFYSAPEPEAVFAARLELELRRRQMDLLRPVENSRFPLWTKRSSFMQTLRARPALVILLILLALGLLTSVAYAISRSLGYVPGVGLVDQEYGIRVLSEPVSAGKDQITVTVTKVVADASRTFITYQVDGIPSTYIDHPICVDPPGLQLPDGRKLDYSGGGAGGMESESGKPMTFETSYTFPAIPAEIKTITFLSPCDQPAISLQLVAAPAGFATPATEIGATFEASDPDFVSTPVQPVASVTEVSTLETFDSALPVTPTKATNGTGLYLEKVLELDNAYILIGNFTDTGGLPGSLAFSGPGDPAFRVEMTDSLGKSVDFQTRPDIHPEIETGGAYYWAYEIPKPIKGPITLTLASVPITKMDRIQFPLNTKDGSKWDLNKKVQLAGYDIFFDSFEKINGGYTAKYHSGVVIPDGIWIQFDILEYSQLTDNGSGEVWNKSDGTVYSRTFIYKDAPPLDNLTLSFVLFQDVQFPGPWTLTWSPPASK